MRWWYIPLIIVGVPIFQVMWGFSQEAGKHLWTKTREAFLRWKFFRR